jgi:hypothetical protein
MNTKEQVVNAKEPTKWAQKQFEFTLYVNDHIIVQRYFNANGYNKFNTNAYKSLDFKYVMDDNMETIKHHLKNKTLDYMMENSRNYYANPSYDQFKNGDVMRMVVKLDGVVIGNREWDATIYPMKIRNSVDIRQHIYDLITRIQNCLSLKMYQLETNYLGYDLVINNKH